MHSGGPGKQAGLRARTAEEKSRLPLCVVSVAGKEPRTYHCPSPWQARPPQGHDYRQLLPPTMAPPGTNIPPYYPPGDPRGARMGGPEGPMRQQYDPPAGPDGQLVALDVILQGSQNQPSSQGNAPQVGFWPELPLPARS